MTAFTMWARRRKLSFASPYPGKIIAIDLIEMVGGIHLPEHAFFAPQKV